MQFISASLITERCLCWKAVLPVLFAGQWRLHTGLDAQVPSGWGRADARTTPGPDQVGFSSLHWSLPREAPWGLDSARFIPFLAHWPPSGAPSPWNQRRRRARRSEGLSSRGLPLGPKRAGSTSVAEQPLWESSTQEVLRRLQIAQCPRRRCRAFTRMGSDWASCFLWDSKRLLVSMWLEGLHCCRCGHLG